MKYFAARLFALTILCAPLGFANGAVADVKNPQVEGGQTQDGQAQDGMSLMQEGMRLLFEGLMDEMEPTLEDLRDLAQEMEPALQDLRDMIGDMGQYHAPEVLPNGDILIRRKTPLTPDQPAPNQSAPNQPAPDEIEL